MTDSGDDIYAGFDEFNSRADFENFLRDEGFQHAVKTTSHGRKPPVSKLIFLLIIKQIFSTKYPPYGS